jgi:hypothetical protein
LLHNGRRQALHRLDAGPELLLLPPQAAPAAQQPIVEPIEPSLLFS